MAEQDRKMVDRKKYKEQAAVCVETAHQLRALLLFQRAQVGLPASIWRLTTTPDSSSRGANTLF